MFGAGRSLLIVAMAIGSMAAGWTAPSPAWASARTPIWHGDAAAADDATSATAVAVAVRVSEAAGVTRLVFDLSGPVAVNTSLTERPDRLIVDLPDINFQIDPAAGRLAGKGVGLIQAFRFGTVAPGRSRIVVDLAGPAALRKAEVASIAGGAPSRLTIELAPTASAAFRAAAGGAATIGRRREPMAAEPVVPLVSPVVVIDAGHGGVDPGAGRSTGILEKDVVLAFAEALAGKLSASGRYKVVLTRHDDSFVSLADRVRIARTAEASLFISVHADMLSDASVTGATVYTASDQASDSEAARVAADENRADEAAGGQPAAVAPDVSGILFDFARRETRTYAHQFQRTLTGYWAKIARLNRNPERAAGFKVLQAPDVPSVLLELGYLSSEKDRAALTSPEWRDRAAGSVAGAIDSFFAARAAEPPVAASPGAAAMR